MTAAGNGQQKGAAPGNERFENCTTGNGKGGRQTTEWGVGNRVGKGGNNQIFMGAVKASRCAGNENRRTRAGDGQQKVATAGNDIEQIIAP